MDDRDTLLNTMARVGINQSDLARLCGVSRQTASRWCNGDRPDKLPPPVYAMTIVRLLDQLPAAVATAEATRAKLAAPPGP